ncbi:hypothetical protein Hanom_Chr05g00421261 [Helianthus anomalus]
MDKKFAKNQDSKKVTMGPKGQPSKRNNIKGEDSDSTFVRIAPFPAHDCINYAYSQAGMSRKRPANTEAHDSDSTFLRITSFPAHRGGPGNDDQNYEYCVVFRKLGA